MDYTIAPNTTAIGAGDGPPTTGTPGEFTEGNPASSTPATVLPAYQMNAIVEEIIAVIKAAGLTLDRTNTAQLLAAINDLIPAQFVVPAASYSATGIIVASGTVVAHSVTFTAPVDGTVVGLAKNNLNNVANAGIATDLIINGMTVSADSTVMSQSHFGVLSVTKGESVTVEVQTTNGSATSPSMTVAVLGFFIPGV